MKTNPLAKVLTALSLTLVAASYAADAKAVGMPFNEGGYTGKLNRSGNVQLMTRRIPGRAGSFMAVLFKKKDEACAYIVDPTETPTDYTMTPLMVTPDGEIGFNNDNPSLMLSISNLGNVSDPEFTLTNANGGNSSCIQGSAVFKGKDSRFHWDQAIVPGPYSAGGMRNVGSFTTNVIMPGDSSQEGTAKLMRPFKRPGNYAVREKAPGLFTLKITGYTAIGATEEVQPTYIGFSASTMWGSQVFLINPADHTDVLPLNAKNDNF